MLALGVTNAWGADDVIDYSTTKSALNSTATSTWKDPDLNITGASGAQYVIHSMGTRGTINALQWNKNGFLYQTKSGGTLKSVIIKGTSDKSVKIYASTSAYSGAASGKAIATLDLTGSDATYTFEENSNYTFLAINGSVSSTSIVSITVTYETTSATPDPVDPTVTFSDGNYTVGGTLNLSTLWTSNSDGAVTYTVKTDGGTGATINGTSFTATAAGTCTVKAFQAATSAYNAIEKTATITVTAPTPATVTLSEAGQEKTVEGKYVGDSYELPSTSTQTCGTKTFVGWSTVEIATPGDKPTSNFYEPGATVTLSAEQTFYAVYATEGEGGGNVFDGTAGGTFKIYAVVDGTNYYATGTGPKISSTENEGEATEYTFTKVSDGVFSIKTSTTYITYASSSNLGTNNTTAYNWEISAGTNGTWRIASEAINARGIIYRASTYKQFGGYALSNVTAGSTEYFDVEIGGGSAASYTDYTTTCSGSTQPVLSVEPENITWKGIAASAEKSEEITVTLSNIEAVMAELSGDNPTAFSIDKDLLEASGKIIVSKNTTTIGDYAAILTITDTDTQTKTIALSMEVVTDPEPTGTFEKFTGTIEEGDYVLVANETTDALKNTITSNRFGCGTVQVVDDKIVNPDKSVIWHIAANGTYWTMYNESTTKYAGGTTTKNQGALLDDVTDLAKWTITVDGEGVYTFENYGRSQQSTDANNKFLSKNNQNAYWATYASGQKNPVLYKKSDGKQPAGLVYETNKYRTKLGDSFVTPTLTNPNSLNVTYSSSNNDVAEVATDGSVTIKAVGGVEITATFAGSETHRQGSAKYTICVTEHAGTEADPYSVADARRVIDVMETAEGVYATGIVSKIVTAYDSEYGNITYNISIDGSTAADQLQAYRGKGVNGENFSSANDIKVGDEVVVKGNLKKYETTYEFDADNQLVSLKRDKQQAGLAYEEKEHTANVGEDFTEPALTNPNSLTVTYSSSNTALATVDATTGEVSILAAGKVTITASSAADATYAAGSASYNITITDPSLAIATLPFYFDGKRADIEGTAGMTQSNLGTDYAAAPYLKFNEEGAWAIVQFDSEPGEFSFLLKQNGSSVGTFTVYESENGEDYTPIWSGGDLGGNAKSATIEPTLSATARYVKFEYTTKPSGTNYGLGSISIAKPDLRQEAGIAWSAETTTITIGGAFTVPTLSNPNGLTGITFTSDNTELATVNDAGVITMKEGITGKAVITANFAGNEDYKSAEVTTTIIVSPETGDVVILAKHQGQWYAMKAEYVTDKTDRLAAVAVNYVGGKLYNVSEEDKAAITWTRSVYGDKVSFQNDGKYLKGKTSTTLILEANEDGLYQWNANDNTMLIGETSRTFIYHKDGMFRNYDVQWASPTSETYSDFPVVTAPVYATAIEINGGDNSTVIGTNKDQTVNVIVDRSFEEGDEWYTLCVPFNMPASVIGKAYQISGLVQKTADYVEVYLAEKTTIVAGEPYLIKPTVTVDKFVVENATIVNTTGASISKSISGLSVTMQGVINGNGGTTDGLYWVGNGGLLYNDTASKSGLRAYFNITTSSGIAPRMRVVAGENVETGLEDFFSTDAPAKVIENGQLIIIRDGVKYNVQGQKL